jgi:DNA-binding transcriptional LysR family regulator
VNSLSGIDVFVCVIEAGGFSAAAKRLHISKSVVSDSVTRLERRLGARLIHRTTRRLTLTEAGRLYFQHCRRIVSEAEAARDAVDRLHGQPRGLLRMTAPNSFIAEHIVPILPEFRALHPEVTFDITAEDRLSNLIEQGFDLSIRASEFAEPGLIVRRLAPMDVAFCAAPSYLQRRGTPRHPRDLADHDSLTIATLASGSYVTMRHRNGEEYLPAITPSFRCNNGMIMREIAIAGGGICYFPTFTIWRALLSGQLRRVLPEWTTLGRTICAVYPDNRLIPPKVRAFVEFLAQRIGDPPYWDRALAAARHSKKPAVA